MSDTDTRDPVVLSGPVRIGLQTVYNGSPFNDFLTGGSADDELYGNAGNDTLRGNGGADLLDGGTGDDRMEGGDGDDTYIIRVGDGSAAGSTSDLIQENLNEGTDRIVLDGIRQSDVVFTPGTNTISPAYFVIGVADGNGGYLYTSIFAGNDLWSYVERIEFANGSYLDATTGLIVTGTASDENLTGASSDDVLTGRGGNDRLTGNGGNDILNGGTGADIMLGGDGDDTYIIKADSGSVVGAATREGIQEFSGGGNNTLRIQGVDAQDVLIYGNGSTHVIGTYDGGTLRETVLYNTGFYGFWTLFSQIEFDDGTIWNASTGLTMRGTSGNDFIFGLSSNDTLIGEGGDDTVSGGEGNDVVSGGAGVDQVFGDGGNDILNGGQDADYVYGNLGDDTFELRSGDGATTTFAEWFYENRNEGTDTLRIYGITADELTITSSVGATDRFGNFDRLHYHFGIEGGSGDILWTSILGWDGYGIFDRFERIEFDDGTVWDSTTGLTQRGLDNADDVMTGTIYGDTLYGLGGDDTINGSNQANDIIIGGKGADIMRGNAGDDTYIVGVGDGAAVLGTEYVTDGQGFDTLHFEGVTYDDLAITISGFAWHFGLVDTNGDFLWTSVFYAGDPTTGIWNQIDQITFDDGTVITSASGLAPKGSSGDDVVQLLDDGGTFDALGGNDTVYGGTGNDTILGNTGDDGLFGANGNDVIDGGVGADTMGGGNGDDTYRIARGDGALVVGAETIYEDSFAEDTDKVLFTDATLSDLALFIGEFDISLGIADSLGTIRWTTISNAAGFDGSDDALWDRIEEIEFSDGFVLSEYILFRTFGNENPNFILGYQFFDEELHGGGGNDFIDGGVGFDRLYGDEGDDILVDRAGLDELHGGTGADTFVFADATSGGTIMDFELGTDLIDLRSIVGARDTIIIRRFTDDDPKLLVEDVVVANPRSTDADGWVEIFFLERGSTQMAINVERRGGSQEGVTTYMDIVLDGVTVDQFGFGLDNFVL